MFTVRIDHDLELKLLEPRHAGALYALIDRNRAHLMPWLPWAGTTRSDKDAEAFIRRALEQFGRNDGFHAGIWHAGELVGTVGLHYLDWTARRTEIGYWLAEDAQNKGIVTRVITYLCRSFFSEYGLNRIEIRCDPANTRSRAVPERLGFTQEGILRQVSTLNGRPSDHVVYSLLEHEWQNHQEHQK